MDVRCAIASADPINDKKHQVAQLTDRLAQLTTRAEQLAERYNKAQYDLGQLNDEVITAQQHLAAKRAQLSRLRSQLGTVALHTFVHAGNTDPILSVLAAGDATTQALKTSYARLAVGNDILNSDQVRRAGLDAAAIQADVEAKQRQQVQAAHELETARTQVEKATADANALLAHTSSDLRLLVQQEQQRRAAAAEAAARALLAQREAAARNAQATNNQAGPARVVTPPPPTSPSAARAVQAALSQLGVPYRWAAASPQTGFDCSGLTMWAWAQAGRPGLPHFAAAQYALLPHVNIEDLRPGDLVFFGRDLHHEGMYIGNGQMVHAPQTGDVVKISSVYHPDFAGAARP